LEPDTFTEEKFKLYENYQHHVHHDPPSKITRSGFRNFLCESPLKAPTPHSINGPTKRLGSYHQCYRLDGKLIAMGVIDLLPHCVSGVYFIYHSDFEKWSFGKISALREACLALEDGYQYYYMGYYIHSCIKMRYKNDYKPQYILDLENLQWDPLNNEVKSLLDQHHYLSVSRERKMLANDGQGEHKASSSPMDSSKDADKRVTFKSAGEAISAVEGGLSLFEVDFPGMMTEHELEQKVDLDEIKIQIRHDLIVEAQVSFPKSIQSRLWFSNAKNDRTWSSGRSGHCQTTLHPRVLLHTLQLASDQKLHRK
jgi:arginine-tRNA-protein transferase